MSGNKKTYWKGLAQLKNDPNYVKHADNEFVDLGVAEDPGHSRRDFLRMMGFSVAVASLAACEAPVRKAIPYISKPIDVDPGIPNYYASSYVNGGDYCSIVVKVRDGRPIKVEGNSLSPVTQGGTSAQVEASVLSLYDNFRLRGPQKGDAKADWETIDKEVISKLEEAAAKGAAIRIVSNTILSPSTLASIAKFKAKYPTTEHIQYDQVSAYGIAKANEENFGKAFIPSYDFSKAKTIVSIDADFLGTWVSPIEFTKQYATTRVVNEDKREMSRHYQFESNLSMTGANADYRTMIKPSQLGLIAAQLYNLVAVKAGKSALAAGIEKVANLEKAAEELWSNKGSALVVCGSNDKAVQIVVNGINDMLGSYGSTINTSLPVNFRKGNDEAMAAFVNDAKEGKLGAVIFYNCNPVYDYPTGEELGNALKNISLTVSTSYTPDETASASAYMAPDHHYLESWNDFEPKPNSYSLSQPAITPIFRTRQAQVSLLTWAGEKVEDYFNVLQENWKTWFAEKGTDFQTFWDKCLYEGVYQSNTVKVVESPKGKEKGKEKTPATEKALTYTGKEQEAATSIASNYKATSDGVELVIYESYGVGNGSQANNPLLQELPDPITKAVWDHYVTISQKDATKWGIDNDAEGNTQKVKLTANGKTVIVAALVQPGQAEGTVGIALGYGRTRVGTVAQGIGVNVYPLVSNLNGSLNYNASTGVLIEKTNEDFQLAQTQIHQTYMGRENVIQEATLAEFKENPAAGREYAKVTKGDERVDASTVSMWKGHAYPNHHWAMSIDLNSCTGCGACVVACNVENNVSLVGKDEVIRRREMHWLRIDRYYSSDAAHDDYKGLEQAAENPEVTFQPMLCQHCNNASCETVCPVAATTHSTEGLNQMTYNRCIGTRYCANNCPYKVRRFNWFKYHDNQKFYQSNPAMNTDLGRMVLNPDVTVRSRGVMEKCSFCIQRIQAGKLNAKRERREVKDGEVVTACQASCTSGAIVFGDINNPESAISKLLKIDHYIEVKKEDGTKEKVFNHTIDKKIGNPRAYRVLEELGEKPNVFYLTKIRNKDKAVEKA
ncbi:MAG: TAT-variant-translocated molybdopterin oxidoreductase [Bacteroidetes bacterium]|nr:TAT-variant-translocated molybdopterin oxidoreductase [Bacteroidota bacterium]MBS1541148.1 TAT-variant-translocated molybdopterin oxidoreductase [Bacteroidota bacterium]